MRQGLLSVLILAIFLGFLFYEAERDVPVQYIKIFVCKDTEARLFFMGEEQDLKNIILKLGIMEMDSCSPKRITTKEWDMIREKLKHRNMAIF